MIVTYLEISGDAGTVVNVIPVDFNEVLAAIDMMDRQFRDQVQER